MAFYLVLIVYHENRKTVSGPFPTQDLAAVALGQALSSGIFESGTITQDVIVPPQV